MRTLDWLFSPPKCDMCRKEPAHWTTRTPSGKVLNIGKRCKRKYGKGGL